MRSMKDRLKDLPTAEKRWQAIASDKELSTKQKLEKLVELSLRREKQHGQREPAPIPPAAQETFQVKEFSYSLTARFGKVQLQRWLEIASPVLAVLANEPEFVKVAPDDLLFFDTETTGIAGGTGVVPFMIGFGYLQPPSFQVKIFLLQDLDREQEMLAAVDEFLQAHSFAAVISFNGRAFDFPLMETRYILYRQRFPLLSLPHLDFLFPARWLWKYTYESRNLGYLGDQLLGISRADDIDASEIPALYFSYLRNREFSLLASVVEHNAMDIVGLAALTLLGALYLQEDALADDEGERLGIALLWERFGDLERAEAGYREVRAISVRNEVQATATRRLSVLLKKKKLYLEALELWKILAGNQDHRAVRELSIHYEHRERNYVQALAIVEKTLNDDRTSASVKKDLEKRWQRIRAKIAALEIGEP